MLEGPPTWPVHPSFHSPTWIRASLNHPVTPVPSISSVPSAPSPLNSLILAAPESGPSGGLSLGKLALPLLCYELVVQVQDLAGEGIR